MMIRWPWLGKFLVDLFAPTLGFLMTLWIVYNVETRFFPVVSDFQIQAIIQNQKDKKLILWGTLDKKRSCELLNLSVYRHPGSEPMELLIQYQKNILGADAGVGPQTWGPIPVYFPTHVKDEDEIEIIALHRCHAVWLQQTQYIRFRYGDMAAIIQPDIPR